MKITLAQAREFTHRAALRADAERKRIRREEANLKQGKGTMNDTMPICHATSVALKFLFDSYPVGDYIKKFIEAREDCEKSLADIIGEAHYRNLQRVQGIGGATMHKILATIYAYDPDAWLIRSYFNQEPEDDDEGDERR